MTVSLRDWDVKIFHRIESSCQAGSQRKILLLVLIPSSTPVLNGGTKGIQFLLLWLGKVSDIGILAFSGPEVLNREVNVPVCKGRWVVNVNPQPTIWCSLTGLSKDSYSPALLLVSASISGGVRVPWKGLGLSLTGRA